MRARRDDHEERQTEQRADALAGLLGPSCKTCDGGGICPDCAGIEEEPPCRRCYGTGECPDCDPTGAVEYASAGHGRRERR